MDYFEKEKQKQYEVMNDSHLKTYLWNRFYEDNHPKYLKYFEKWYNNLTINQIYYFNIDYEKSK